MACVESASCLDGAAVQLNGCILDTALVYHKGEDFTVFQGFAALEVQTSVYGVPTNLVFKPTDEIGIIGYERNVDTNWINEVTRAFNRSRQIGLPPVQPPRRLGFP